MNDYTREFVEALDRRVEQKQLWSGFETFRNEMRKRNPELAMQEILRKWANKNDTQRREWVGKSQSKRGQEE